MKNSEIKNYAKSCLKGHWSTAIAVALLVGVLTCLGSITGLLAPFYTLLVMGPVICGHQAFYLHLVQGEKVGVGDLFYAFKYYSKALVMSFLVNLFIALWTLLLIVPGIIKTYSYSMSYFILAEHQELSAKEAIDRSKKMMEGHKMDLFLLHLSFIGWILLSILTLGIGFFYTIPYMGAAMASFYRNLEGGTVSAVVEEAALPEADEGVSSVPEAVLSQAGGSKGTVVLNQSGTTTVLVQPAAEPNCGGLVGLSGGLSGQDYSLPDGFLVIIGRDEEQSSVLTSPDNVSISRKHCTVCYSAAQDAYLVEDFSANGVFVEGGSRLAKNTPQYMPHGTVLYLGDRKESFRLD